MQFFHFIIDPEIGCGVRYIDSSTKNKKGTPILYNATGKLIQSNKNIYSSLRFDLSNYSKGIYFLKIKFKNNSSPIVEKLLHN